MIHVAALPGTPAYKGNIKEIIAKAVNEAKIYQYTGVDMLLIENMHDVPYLNGDVGHEISTMMTRVCTAVKQQTNLPCGVQILAGANQAALAVALAAGLDFIRAEGFVFAHVGDEGMMQSNAATLLRYRKQIGAEQIDIMTDIQKKHSSHAITADISIEEMAATADFFRSDGLILTGRSTGQKTALEDIKKVRKASDLPIWVGSGVNHKNVNNYISLVDGMIVGSAFKKEGYWANEVDIDKVTTFVNLVKDK